LLRACLDLLMVERRRTCIVVASIEDSIELIEDLLNDAENVQAIHDTASIKRV
jgi:hypothetical protein